MKTTIKNFIGALTFLALISTVNAQIFSAGVVAGVSSGAVRIENINKGFTNAIEGKNIMGYEVGLFAKVKFTSIYIKPMALYDFSSGQVKYSGYSGTPYETNFTIHKAEVPLLFGLNIIGHYLSVEAGPVYNYIIDVTKNYSENTIAVQRSGIGYRAGLASELGPILLYASYGGAVNSSSGVDNATFREPSKLIFGAGLKFGKLEEKKKSKKNSDEDRD